jgi:hypothetical protein
MAPVCSVNLQARELNPSRNLHVMAVGNTVPTESILGQAGLASTSPGVVRRIALLLLVAHR